MKIRHYKALLVLLALPLAASSTQRVPARAPTASDATLKAVDAAKVFLATLDDRQRASARLDLNKRTRYIWTNLPTGVLFHTGATDRNGVKFGYMTAALLV